MNTFKVAECKINAEEIKAGISMDKALSVSLGKANLKVEGISSSDKFILGSPYNALIDSCYIAFGEHKRLILSPDIIWLAILQQLSIHVNNNSEALRKKFVQFEGKQSILIHRDDFRLGANNPWHNVFPEFSAKIREYIGGENHSNIISNFSTTNSASKIAFEISLMDVVKSYFRYGMSTLCGIPEITLEGTTDDWKILVEKARKLSEYDLDWWITNLIPVLEQFVSASENKVDLDFWQSFFKLGGGSGGPFIDGHVNMFFPYVKKYESDTFIKNKSKGRYFSYNKTSDFPSGLASVPFLWFYFGKTLPMNFVAGFIGTERTNESIKPNIGWGVLHREETQEKIIEEDNAFRKDYKGNASDNLVVY